MFIQMKKHCWLSRVQDFKILKYSKNDCGNGSQVCISYEPLNLKGGFYNL